MGSSKNTEVADLIPDETWRAFRKQHNIIAELRREMEELTAEAQADLDLAITMRYGLIPSKVLAFKGKKALYLYLGASVDNRPDSHELVASMRIRHLVKDGAYYRFSTYCDEPGLQPFMLEDGTVEVVGNAKQVQVEPRPGRMFPENAFEVVLTGQPQT